MQMIIEHIESLELIVRKWKQKTTCVIHQEKVIYKDLTLFSSKIFQIISSHLTMLKVHLTEFLKKHVCSNTESTGPLHLMHNCQTPSWATFALQRPHAPSHFSVNYICLPSQTILLGKQTLISEHCLHIDIRKLTIVDLPTTKFSSSNSFQIREMKYHGS